MKKFTISVLALFFLLRLQAQTDSSAMAGIFDRLTNEMKSFKVDTSDVPQDKLTRAIIEFRQLRGGFNINEAIKYKMEEEEKKNPGNPQAAYLRQQFENGDARRWLDNATIHIYRDEFTYREMKKLIKFYKTSAGQKLAMALPETMLKTTAATEYITALLAKK